MNVLVTGSAGFIGWKVSEFLLADGQRVVGVDNINDAYDVRLKNWRLAQLQGRPGFEFHHLDICDREALRSFFVSEFERRRNRPDRPNRLDGPFDSTINLAARAGVRQSVQNPRVYFETNVTGTLNLLELCKEFGINKFILASTSSLYGSPDVIRQSSSEATANSESQMANSLKGGPASKLSGFQAADQSDRPSGPNRLDRPNRLARPFRESDPTDRPLSPYAASKKGAEALCYTYHYLFGLDVTVLRYFTVYGPAGRPDMSLFRFVQRISENRVITVYGDGEQSRDFTYVDDVARGTVAALKPVGYEIINLGSDQPVVLRDAIGVVERRVGRQAKIEFRPRHPADVMATWADIEKAKRLLDWQPTRRFEDGVKDLVDWYRKNREWAREIKTN